MTVPLPSGTDEPHTASSRADRDSTWTGPATQRFGIATIVLGAWTAAWVGVQVVSTAIVSIADEPTLDAIPIPLLGLATLAGWCVYLVAATMVSRQAGTGRARSDYRIQFSPRDLIGFPIGVVTQLVALTAIYWPLRVLWPDVFSDQRLEQNANDLADRASGVSVLVLIAMVVIGAPIVEELVYRGMLQMPLSTRFHPVVVWLFVAALFTGIHFRPVEYPGLFVFALVVGACALLTGRLGMSIVVHIAFNATGLSLAL